MQLSDRQMQLMKFLASVTVAPKILLEDCFGPTVAHDLKHLKALNLARHRPWIGRATLWQLTVAGCRLVGVSEEKSKPLGGQALHQKILLGHLVACDGYSLIDRSKLAEALPEAPASVPFIFWKTDDKPVVFRCLTPGLYTDPRAVARSIETLEKRQDKDKFNPGQFGYLVIVTNDLRKKAISTALKAAKLYGQDFVLRIEVVNASTH